MVDGAAQHHEPANALAQLMIVLVAAAPAHSGSCARRAGRWPLRACSAPGAGTRCARPGSRRLACRRRASSSAVPHGDSATPLHQPDPQNSVVGAGVAGAGAGAGGGAGAGAGGGAGAGAGAGAGSGAVPRRPARQPPVREHSRRQRVAALVRVRGVASAAYADRETPVRARARARGRSPPARPSPGRLGRGGPVRVLTRSAAKNDAPKSTAHAPASAVSGPAFMAPGTSSPCLRPGAGRGSRAWAVCSSAS